jgi:uncharacterized protein (TIGR03435 family)
MMRNLLVVLLFAAPIFAEGPEFEVASIKPFEIPQGGPIRLGPSGGGPGTADPTHLSIPLMTLKNLITQAFDMKIYQVFGPATLDSERFSFSVVLPEGSTKDDLKIMWRNLLISRFGLKYHIEQREFQVDELVVGPRGHKLVENNEEPPPPAEPSSTPQPRPITIGKDGKPTLPGPALLTMFRTSPNGVTASIMAKAQPMGALATVLSGQLGHPVVDKTGLTAKYDFTVDFADPRIAAEMSAMMRTASAGAGAAPPAAAGTAPPALAAPEEASLELPAALQQQLGLRLVKGKGMLDVVVVDKIERTPTEN